MCRRVLTTARITAVASRHLYLIAPALGRPVMFRIAARCVSVASAVCVVCDATCEGVKSFAHRLQQPPESSGGGWNKRAKIAVGLGVGILGLALLIMLIFVILFLLCAPRKA